VELTFVPAMAAFGGSATGGFAAAFMSWLSQRREQKTHHTLRLNSQRQKLYKAFIEEASRLYAHALTNNDAEPSSLVDLYALIGRMKIISNDEVNKAAENAAEAIIQAYLHPNKSLGELPDFIKQVDPLRDFSEACRRELHAGLPRAG
jgi:hypothetical protein